MSFFHPVSTCLKNVWLALGLGGFAFVVGCQQNEFPGNAMAVVDVVCPNYKKVVSETTAVMSEHRYRLATPLDSSVSADGSPYLASQGLRPLSFTHGGQAHIEIIPQPTPEGWRLYAMAEPEKYSTYFPYHKIRSILKEIRKRCETIPPA